MGWLSIRGRRSFTMSPLRPTSARRTSPEATNRLWLGDKVRQIPGHCDPAVNLYDWYVCVRGNRVGQVWPITARWAVY
jgi:D-serine deaminase-like pyridoxal phosphate-dependent protein